MMTIQHAIALLIEGRNLSEDQVAGSLEEIVDGRATPAQVGGFLVALRGKGETVDEIASFASAFRRYSLRIDPVVAGRLVDTCGTGGDGVKSFNVSTVAAVVAAGAGVPIAKHGNRSVTSKCGSADLLEHLGFNIEMDPARVKESIERIGIGFMFAPAFHPAMKRVVPIRRELGIRTIFNLMGPLINPAGANAQLLGVYSASMTALVANALAKLGSEEAMVIHGTEGMDEISIAGSTIISWLRDGEVTTREYGPRDFGLSAPSRESMAVASTEESARAALDVLTGARSGAKGKLDMVVVNAAAAIIVSGMAEGFDEAVPAARESIQSGAALQKLEDLIRFSGGTLRSLERDATSR